MTPALEAKIGLSVGGASDVFHLDVELVLERGVLVLFGPSGAGKSITVHALAGILRPRRGFIRVAGQTLYQSDLHIHVPAHLRGIGYVPQHPSLFPFRDVWENVAFGLPRALRRRDNKAILALLEELELLHRARARPDSLSGGERQKVALARALAVQPRLLLLDEPFASNDQSGRTALQRLLRKTLDRHAIPTVIVTHDADEAVMLGDTLVTFDRGRTTACGTPAELLTEGRDVELFAQVRGSPRPAGPGRSEVTLESATLRGPATLFSEVSEDRIELSLRTRTQRHET